LDFPDKHHKNLFRPAWIRSGLRQTTGFWAQDKFQIKSAADYQNYYFQENGVQYAFQEEKNRIFSIKRCNDHEGDLQHLIPFLFSKDTCRGALKYMIHSMDIPAAEDQIWK
jgi:hypothetical protein